MLRVPIHLCKEALLLEYQQEGVACRYKKRDYVLAVAITTGLMLFFLTGPVSSKKQNARSDAVMWGSALMLGYLGFDGFTSTFQDRLFKGYSMSAYNQMLYVNMFSAAVSFCGAHFSTSWYMSMFQGGRTSLIRCHD
jgi:hypothetical protein